MVTFDGSIHIDRPPATVFDVVGTHLFETQPEWEDGIVAIHPLTEGPIRVGTIAVMVRADLGKWRRKTNYQCVVFEGNWSADKPTLDSINRILGRRYANVKFFTFSSDYYDAPYLEATMPDGQVRTPYEMSSGELWVLFCIWELDRSAATDIILNR